jgi:hypothetical protein
MNTYNKLPSIIAVLGVAAFASGPVVSAPVAFREQTQATRIYEQDASPTAQSNIGTPNADQS